MTALEIAEQEIARLKIMAAELVIERDCAEHARKRLVELVAENQQAWEGEEDSVQAEHRDLINKNAAELARTRP